MALALLWDLVEIGMSALYVMKFGGRTGDGGGVLYIGNGRILGADVSLCRYNGIYEEKNGVFSVEATITAPPEGAYLVTGITIPSNISLPITAELPMAFDTGDLHVVSVGGLMVQVSFEKLGDVP